MSTAYSSAKQKYIGNGVTTEWGFDFPIQKHSELKVYLKRSGLPQVLLEEGVDYSFVTENTIAFPIKTGEAKLQATDVLALQRESVFESEYNFSNQQRLEPEEVMHADDNLERQIQELKRDSESAIKVQPTSNINTDEYFIAVESIYENLDNITTVSGISAEIVTCSNNIEAIQDAPNQANAASQSASDASQSASDASQSATNAANSATDSANSATDSANSATASATSAQAAQDAADKVQDLIATPIGTIFQSVYVDESLDIARRLNGQLISSTKFTGFRSWLNTVQTVTPNLFTTETNWQSEKALSKFGQVGKFVIDDTAQTIRLPCVVNAQGLVDLALIGGIKSESLPNIKGEVGYASDLGMLTSNVTRISGAFKKGQATTAAPTGDNKSSFALAFDASGSSSTYQNNAPVQQEAVQYPYYIQVATGIEETLPAIREYEINTPFFFGQSMYSDVAPDNASWLVSNGQYNAKTVYPDYYDWLLEKRNSNTKTFYLWKNLAGDAILFLTETNTLSVGSALYGYNPTIKFGEITAISGNNATVRNYLTNTTNTTPVNLSNPTYAGNIHVYDSSKMNVISKEDLDNWNIPINTSDYDFVINTADQTFRLPLLNGDRVLVKKYVNGTDWYNLYSDGWIEQGGSATGIPNFTISFLKPFRDANYTITTTTITGNGDTTVRTMEPILGQILASSCVLQSCPSFNGTLFFWQACGYAPVPTQSDFTEVEGLYYYVGDTVQDASLINAGAVLGQLSNKADIDASNFNADGKSLLSGLGMPSSRYIDLTLGASGSSYTAPANGWLILNKAATNVGQEIRLTNQSNQLRGYAIAAMNSAGLDTMIPCRKGDTIHIYYSAAGSVEDFRFIYAEGEN